MVGRLILALLLALGALPAAAMPVTCHADPTMVGMVMNAPADDGRAAGHHRHHMPAVEHGCIGCAALADRDVHRIAVPVPGPVVPPVPTLARLTLGASPPPMLRPPRIG